MVLGKGHSYQGVFRQLIEEAVAAGEVRGDLDPRLAALSILGSANWVYRWFRPGGRFSARTVAREFAEMAILGIGTEAGLAARADRLKARAG